MKRLLIGAVVLVALVVFGSMKHPHKHLAINPAPQDPVVSSARQVTVEIREFDFFPRELTTQAGSAVTWVNRDAAPHDATDQAGGWTTGMLKQGQSMTLAFDSPGVYQYHCTIHPNMQATLTVSDRLTGARKATLLARGQTSALRTSWCTSHGFRCPRQERHPSP